MKKLLAASAVALVLGLTACSPTGTRDEPVQLGDRSLIEIYVQTSDGRTVMCLSGTYKLSCDWDNAE